MWDTVNALLRALRRFIMLSAVCMGAAACAFQGDPQGDVTNDARLAQRLEAASPARGRAYAELACAACHAVAPGDTSSPNPAAPAFQSVANWPGMTGIALHAWLRTSHPTMPDLIVEPDRIDDLSAYLATLKERET